MKDQSRPEIYLIAAINQRNVIGDKGSIPWHLPDDLAHFSRLTRGHTMIMGRKTYQSLGKPLKNRHHIVLSRSMSAQEIGHPDVTLCHNLQQALALLPNTHRPVFVIGGERVYQEALPLASKLYITHVDNNVTGDAYFPSIDEQVWQKTETRHQTTDNRHEYAMTFTTYQRRF